MPPPIKVLAGAFLILLLLRTSLPAYEPPAAPAPRPFQYAHRYLFLCQRDGLELCRRHVQADDPDAKTKKRDYTRRCFVVTRAAVQFWKFARFDPDGRAALATINWPSASAQVTERSVWLPALPQRQRIVFPGYANLRDISAAEPGIFQANIGLGWPVYFRAGNMPIVVPVCRDTEARLNDEIFHDLQMNYPTIVWLYNFPSLNINHVVVIIAGKA